MSLEHAGAPLRMVKKAAFFEGRRAARKDRARRDAALQGALPASWVEVAGGGWVGRRDIP
jgi:hypothetical protein